MAWYFLLFTLETHNQFELKILVANFGKINSCRRELTKITGKSAVVAVVSASSSLCSCSEELLAQTQVMPPAQAGTQAVLHGT